MHAIARTAKIQALENQLRLLKHGIRPAPEILKPDEVQPIYRFRSARIVLPGEYVMTTHRGSMYSTVLLVLAGLGKLATHDVLFSAFRKQPNKASARKFLDEIGVNRDEVEAAARKDPEFRAHCKLRTRCWRSRAAKGEPKAKRVMRNRKIFDASGRWHGDFNEAFNILCQGANPERQANYKNSGLLRHATARSAGGLLFDRSYRAGQAYLYLYPRKHFVLFQRARALAGE